MSRHFEAAPWATVLTVITVAVSALMALISYGAYRVIPRHAGFADNVGALVAAVPLVVVAWSLFFVVRGYSLDPAKLSIERLITSTTIPLGGLTRAWIDREVLKGSLRVFGNGGLFAFSGWFYSKRLGRYRVFATSFSNAVVLSFRSGNVVVSPDSPEAFLQHLRLLVPDLDLSAPAA